MRKKYIIIFISLFLLIFSPILWAVPGYTMKYFPNSVLIEKNIENDSNITIYKSREWPEDIFSKLVFDDFYALVKKFKRFDKVIYSQKTGAEPDYIIRCKIKQAIYKGNGSDVFFGEIKGASAYVELEVSLFDEKNNTYLIDDIFKGIGRSIKFSGHSHDPTWKYGDKDYRRSSLRVAILNAIKSFLGEVDKKLPLEEPTQTFSNIYICFINI